MINLMFECEDDHDDDNIYELLYFITNQIVSNQLVDFFLPMLVCDWPHSVWTKLLVCKVVVLQGIPLFRSVSEDSTVRKVGSLSAVQTMCHHVRTLICPLFHPSGRRAIPSGRPDRPSIIRPDDVDFRTDPSLHREASIPACIRPDF
jgi:hypothetical protein